MEDSQALILVAWFYTIVAPLCVIALPVFVVKWHREKRARRRDSDDHERDVMLLARKVIERHMPAAVESSHFWPYRDVLAAAYGLDGTTKMVIKAIRRKR